MIDGCARKDLSPLLSVFRTILRDTGDTPHRRSHSRNGCILRDRVGLMTGLGWSVRWVLLLPSHFLLLRLCLSHSAPLRSTAGSRQQVVYFFDVFPRRIARPRIIRLDNSNIRPDGADIFPSPHPRDRHHCLSISFFRKSKLPWPVFGLPTARLTSKSIGAIHYPLPSNADSCNGSFAQEFRYRSLAGRVVGLTVNQSFLG